MTTPSTNPNSKEKGTKPKPKTKNKVQQPLNQITEELWEELLKLNDPEAEIRYIADYMDMKGWKDGELLVAIQLSIYHETFKFTKSIGLNHPQANTIYGIIQNTIESIANSVKDTSTYLEEFKKLLLKVLRSPMHQETMDSYNETIPLEKFPAIVNFAMKTVFQHIQLYRFVFTQEQSISLIPITKQFETIPIYEPLKEAVIPKIDIEREVEELIQQDWLDPFAADLDIFDSLSPAEIKTVVYDTIVSMIKNLQSDCDRMVMDHQLKISNRNLKHLKDIQHS